jgi:BirA family transcriptional regulator, biotin operon repressor / biotin---[acetyl-CoA-carboxylase] ligase
MIDAKAPIEIFDEIDSTLLEARRRAERGALTPVWLIAKRQTAGRGRRGRAWSSFDGNLMATLLFTTDRPPQEVALLGFVTGVAIAETVESHIGAGRVTLKWPNDVFIDSAKASGILIDSGAAPGGGLWVALAFGVNVAAAPEGIDQPTISLRQILPPDAPAPNAIAFFAALRPRLERWSMTFASEAFGPVRAAWLARAHGLGREARVRLGETELAGRILGISERGELELETAEGRRFIAAGDVFFPEAHLG